MELINTTYITSVVFVSGYSTGSLCDNCTVSHDPTQPVAKVFFSDEPQAITHCRACYGRLGRS